MKTEESPEQNPLVKEAGMRDDLKQYILVDGCAPGCAPEENLKIKVVIPWLRALGWDLLSDLYFEDMGADIRVGNGQSEKCFLVETKAFDVELSNDKILIQCADYLRKHQMHFIVLTNGRDTRVYDVLSLFGWLKEKSRPPDPLIRVTFADDLSSTSREFELDLALSKEEFGHKKYSKVLWDKLKASGLWDNWSQYVAASEDVFGDAKDLIERSKSHLTEKEFEDALKGLENEDLKTQLSELSLFMLDFADKHKITGNVSCKTKSKSLKLTIRVPNAIRWESVVFIEINVRGLVAYSRSPLLRGDESVDPWLECAPKPTEVGEREKIQEAIAAAYELLYSN
ncbi:type I restriction enzyme HsdR N-terminal domain-containing protein, partial [Myxococcota bacterium]|nr:type I restriction enzyme HsdR N-terminal domain-containing protein [Myxococcota bacterium]